MNDNWNLGFPSAPPQLALNHQHLYPQTTTHLASSSNPAAFPALQQFPQLQLFGATPQLPILQGELLGQN